MQSAHFDYVLGSIAWGNCIVEEIGKAAISCGLGYMNPIRYRGYYYDYNLGLYDLTTRYYDPETGRFTSADTVDYLAPDTVNGLNLYAYCDNNPVMYSDLKGHVPFFFLTALVGAAIGLFFAASADIQDDGYINASITGTTYIGATFAGLLVGTALGMALSYYATGNLGASVGKVFNGLFGKTTFYRTMSVDDYFTLKSSGKIPAGRETFISPSFSYASQYNGVTVKFTVRNRTVNWLEKIGVRNASTQIVLQYPSMPVVSNGWMANSAYFKFEKGLINIGLGNGKALKIFNRGILLFGAV